MPRRPGIWWDDREKSYRSDCGPVGSTGRRKPVYFRDHPHTDRGERAAKEELRKYIDARDKWERAQEANPSNPLVAEMVISYLENLRKLVTKDEASEHTIRSHKERLQRFLGFVGPDGVPMAERRALTLTDDDGAQFLTWCEDVAKLGAKRREGLLASLKACFSWASDSIPGRIPKQILPANPFEDLKPPSVPRTKRPFVNRKEFAAFLRYAWRRANEWTPIEGLRCSGCVRAEREVATRCRRSHALRHQCHRATVLLFRIQFHAGNRPGELCKATKEGTKQCPEAGWQPRFAKDENGHWWGLLTLHGKTTRSTGRLRELWIPPRLAKAVGRLLAQELHPTHIFCHPARLEEGTRPWTSAKLANRVGEWRDEAVAAQAQKLKEGKLKGAKIPPNLTLYSLRHTWYSAAVFEAGLSPDQAGAVGGTSGKTVEKNYARARQEANLRVAIRAARAARDVH